MVLEYLVVNISDSLPLNTIGIKNLGEIKDFSYKLWPNYIVSLESYNSILP